MKRIFITLCIISVLFLTAAPTVVLAQSGGVGEYAPLSPIPGLTPAPGEELETTSYLENLFLFGIGIAAVLAVVMIVIGGVQYVTSSAFDTKSEAKKRILSAIGGFILVLAAWLILNTINPELLRLNIPDFRDTIQSQNNTGDTENTGETIPPGTPPDGEFTLGVFGTPQIGTQFNEHQSQELSDLLDCMAARVPGNVGRISSISDDHVVACEAGGNSRETCFDLCRTGTLSCAHTTNSCHYGGDGQAAGCGEKSFAVDFGDEQNEAALRQAALECGTTPQRILGPSNSSTHQDHVHISVPNPCNCN